MADFCKQCSEEIFGEDSRELADLGGKEKLEPGYGWIVLCEGCGPTRVDDDGKCMCSDCDKKHGRKAEDEVSHG